MAKKGDHVFMGNAGRSCLYCSHCGEEFPIPIGAMRWVVGVANAFAREHRGCKSEKRHGHRLCGLQELPGVNEGIPLEPQEGKGLVASG